jgi:hypothetical protein
MKFSSLVIAIAAIFFFAACSSSGEKGGGKKLVVWSNGKIELDAANKTTINFEPSNRHNELEVPLTADDKKITIKTAAGDKTYDLPEDGLYLLNLKVDTVIGSIVNFTGSQQRTNIGTEELNFLIDSTKKLMSGEGASDAKKTYWVPPNSIKKITTNISGTLLSPYKNIPYEVTPDEKGNAPEFYKFFTNSQKRETLKELIDRLSK